MACKNCPSGVNMRGGTGAPPPYFFQSYTGATSNGLDYNTALEFCYPIPGAPFNLNTEPPRNRCGSYIRDLKDFPLNQATTTDGNIRTFGTSEMVLVFVKFRNYPRSGGECIIDFHRPDGSILWSTGSMVIPAPSSSWEWWESWFWACIGKFDSSSGFSGDEIIEPGNYVAMVRSSFGTAEIDYQVVDTGCLPYWQCEQPLNGYMSDGCGHRQIGNCAPIPPVVISNVVVTQDSTTNNKKTITVVGTGTGEYTSKLDGITGTRQLTNGNDQFTLYNLSVGNHTICANSICRSFTVDDPTPINRWSCGDSCANPHAIGEYASKNECLAGCQNMWGWQCVDGVCKQTVTGLHATKAACEAAGCGNTGNIFLKLEVERPPEGQKSFMVGDTIRFHVTSNLPNGTVIQLKHKLDIYNSSYGTGTIINGECIILFTAPEISSYQYYVSGGGIIIPYESNAVAVYITKDGLVSTPEDWKEIAMYGIAGLGGALILSSLLGRR